MTRTLQIAGLLLFLLAGLGIGVLTYDAHQLARHADAALADLDQTIRQQSLDLSEDEIHLDAVLGQLEGTVKALNVAAQQQQSYWAKVSSDSDKTVKALRLTTDRIALLADHTDKALTGYILPDFDRQMNFTAERAQQTLDGFSHASDALTFQLNDLTPVMTNLGQTSAQLAQASGHANKILADGEHTADYYEKRLTTPASFAHRLGMGLLDVGSKLGNIMAGFVK